MPPRKPAPSTPLVVVRKKRPSISTATSPAGGKPQPKQPNAAPQQPLPKPSLAPAVLPRPSSEVSVPTNPEQPNYRQRQRQAGKEFLTVLCARWPQVFPADSRLVKPFAIGIHHEIQKALPEVKSSLIRHALYFYQHDRKGAYWKAILNGESRYNLDGIPTAEVTEQDKEHARHELEAMAAWWRAQRKRRRQAEAVPSPSPALRSDEAKQ